MGARRVAIVGATGQLGTALVSTYEAAGAEVHGFGGTTMDITSVDQLARLGSVRPNVVVNAAAWTDVDGCARDPERAMLVNGQAAGLVAKATADLSARIVHISTNEVFDGLADRLYREDDAPNPSNAYGRSKLLGERSVVAANPDHLVIRTAWLFGPGGSNFVTKILAAAQRADEAGEPLRVVADEWGNPTWTLDLAAAIVRATETGITGILHLAGEPATSRFDWAVAALRGASRRTDVVPVSGADYQRPSSPPPHAVLDLSLARALDIRVGEWPGALERYVSRP
jgi:dTDP-4-dehydrorhamnose reductase